MSPPEPKRIRSRENPLIKRIHRLATVARERRGARAALLDGPHLVAAFRARGGRAEAVLVSESALAHPEVSDLFDTVDARERAVVADRVFGEIAQVTTPVGLLAWVTAPDPGPPPAAPGDCVLLEAIQDTGNLGSILRSADAAGIREIYLSPGSAFAWSPKVLRAGMGAHFGLSVYENAPLAEIAGRFRGEVIATALDARASIFDLDLTGPVAWVFGNEGAGISAPLERAATRRARIPMPGGAESLNVAASAAICFFERVRQLSSRAAPASPLP